MGALQDIRITRQVAMLIALSTCVWCRSLSSQPNGSLVNGTLAIVNGGNSNIGGGENDAHGKRNVETIRSSKDKPYKVNDPFSNGSLPNGSVGNRGDSNGENDTHGKTHVEGDNETVGSSKGKQDKNTSGTSALVFSSAILACLLATLLVPSCIT